MRSIAIYLPLKVLKYSSLLVLPLGLNATMTLNFVDGVEVRSADSSGQSLDFHIKSQSGRHSVHSGEGKARVDAVTRLTGESSMDAAFELRMAAGFAFDHQAPTYDLTDHSGAEPSKNAGFLRLRPSGGWAPRGDGNGFNSGEILHFTVRGLQANQRLRIKAFSMGSQNPERMNFYYNGVSVPEHREELTRVSPQVEGADARFDLDAKDILIRNGERFGWGWATNKMGNRSGIRSIEFEVVEVSESYTAAIPESSTYPMCLMLFASQLVLFGRRKPAMR